MYCAHVLGREPHAGAFADPLAVVLAVLQVAHLGVGGELGMVLVADPGLGQAGLQALGVGPRVAGCRARRGAGGCRAPA